MRHLILIGPMGAGKSALAKMLAERKGYTIHPIAGAIKWLAGMAFPGIGKETQHLVQQDFQDDGMRFPVRWMKGREIFQQLGAAVREMDRLFWLRIWSNALENIGHAPVVVDDARLDLEISWARAALANAFVLKVYASQEVREHRIGGPQHSGDPTEWEWETAIADAQLDTSGMDLEAAYARLLELADLHP